METLVYDFDEAVSAYAIADAPVDRFKNHLPVADGKLVISYTTATQVHTAQAMAGGMPREVAVIGICVDSHKKHDDQPEQAASYLAGLDKSDVESVYRASRRFAGRFIVFYRLGDAMYLFGDAYGMLQINYARIGGHFCAAVTDKLVGDHFGLEPSPESLEIQYSGGLERPMPYDMTMYDGVKALLADHYLDLSSMEASRIKLQFAPQDTPEKQRAVIDRTVTLVDNILDNYLAMAPIACPLTGGHDSRVVFAFLKRLEKELKCYTFHHAGFTEDHYDLAIPRAIAKDYDLDYSVYNILTPPPRVF